MPTFTRRELPRAEWPRLAATGELRACLTDLPPDSRIVVVESPIEGIIGTWAVIRYTHVEGLWIAESHRAFGRVGAHLLAGMETIAREQGQDVVLTSANTDTIRALIAKRGGVPLPGDHFVLPLGGAF